MLTGYSNQNLVLLLTIYCSVLKLHLIRTCSPPFLDIKRCSIHETFTANLLSIHLSVRVAKFCLCICVKNSCLLRVKQHLGSATPPHCYPMAAPNVPSVCGWLSLTFYNHK